MGCGVKFKKVSSVKSTDIGEPVSVGIGVLFSCRAPEYEQEIPFWVSNTHTFSCMGGIL